MSFAFHFIYSFVHQSKQGSKLNATDKQDQARRVLTVTRLQLLEDRVADGGNKKTHTRIQHGRKMQ